MTSGFRRHFRVPAELAFPEPVSYPMITILTALAVAAAAPASAAAAKPADHAKPAGAKAAPAPVTRPDSVDRVAAWVTAESDNGGLPFIIIDKPGARLFLFDAKGQQLATAPVLLGIALGDEATPGVGAKSLAEIGPAEKTTPAGRFLARFGRAAGNAQVLWVDYGNSVAMHPIPSSNPKERRRQRMLSATPDDNRITFGCINVPKALYDRSIRPLFRSKGGYVYVLPDTRPLVEVFPRLAFMPAPSPAPAPAPAPAP